MTKVLILGETGQLARSLSSIRWPAAFSIISLGRDRLGDPSVAARSAAAAIADERPRLVLNAAAFTAVDRAETESMAAHALNADLPRAVAVACGAMDVPLVHISTDYVFDGEKRSPYLETDAPNPLGVYGASKLAGDRAIEQAALRRWAILRSSWVVSEIGESFPVKLLRRARAGEALRVVDDQRGCPTAAADLARAMQAVGLRLLDDDRSATGLFNYCGASEMSWHGFAERLLAAAEPLGLRRPPLHAISSAALKAPARRPAYSVLSCARIGQACGLSGVAIEADLGRMVRAILAD